MATNIEQEIAELKRRVGHTETRIALEGQFEFISGQLRDIQRHMQFDSLRADLPGIVADALGEVLRSRGYPVCTRQSALPALRHRTSGSAGAVLSRFRVLILISRSQFKWSRV